MTRATMLVCRNSHVAADIRAVLPVDTLVVGDISGQVWETYLALVWLTRSGVDF